MTNESQTTDDGFEEALGKLISELANRPIEIDSRRVRWCLDHGVSPFALADGKHESWQLVTEEQLEAGISNA